MPSGVYIRTRWHLEIIKKSHEKLKGRESILRGKKRPEFAGKNNPNWKEKVTFKCHQCGKIFKDSESACRKFCSRECYTKDWIKRMAKNEKLIKNRFKKGNKSWIKGLHPEYLQGENHPMWKGNKAKYSALHMRVRDKRGNPSFCEICKTSDKRKKYQWANLTGKYEDVMDYKRMCVPCHSKYDNDRRK